MLENILERLSSPIPYKKIAIFFLPCLCLLLVLITSISSHQSQQYSLLAKAFLHGQLNFLHPIGGAGQDPVYYHGKIYWSEGVFPAILLLPFVALFSLFHVFFLQNYLQWLLCLGVGLLVFKLARHLNYSSQDSVVLALGFTLGSVFIGVASDSCSWYFAQVVTSFLLFWSFYEYLVRKRARWWLIGIICGLTLLTRPTAAPILIFYVLELWRSKASNKLNKLIQLLTPVVVALILMGLYNYLRFHSPFQAGYADQVLFPTSVASEKQGLFSLIHVPANLYSFLLGAPANVLKSNNTWTLKFPYIENNNLGMSIFITSPYFLYLLSQKWSSFSSRAKHLLAASLVSGILVFSYFGIGIAQYGYRYSLDFLPELFLIFMVVYRRNNKCLSRGMKTLLLGAGIFNFFLLFIR